MNEPDLREGAVSNPVSYHRMRGSFIGIYLQEDSVVGAGIELKNLDGDFQVKSFLSPLRPDKYEAEQTIKKVSSSAQL